MEDSKRLLRHPRFDHLVEFCEWDLIPGKIGVMIHSDEPTTLWLSPEAARVVYADLKTQGYTVDNVTPKMA